MRSRKRALFVIATFVVAASATLLLGSRDAAATHESCLPNNLNDTDGDGLPDTCDPNNLAWDADGDGYSDSLERFLGTDPTDVCSTIRRAFPPDLNADAVINGSDFNPILTSWQATIVKPGYRAMADLYYDQKINGTDFNPILSHWQQRGCPFPQGGSSKTVSLQRGIRHFELAQLWTTNHAELTFQTSSW